MARTECPECRHVAAVKRERLGRRVKCPNCEHVFQADSAGTPWHRLASADHPAGLWVGILLVLFAAVVGGGAALAADTPSGGPSLASLGLNVTALGGLAGVVLIGRYCTELSRRPVPIGKRPP
jgi:predicted Zn finger-like uncharacterized protein